MPFERADRFLSLRFRRRDGKIGWILRVEPDARVNIEQPVPPALGIAQLRLERPSVDAPVDDLLRRVLPRRCNHLQASAEKHFLPPLYKVPQWQGGPSNQIHREA